MIKTYILIISIFGADSSSTQKIEFDTFKACDIAGKRYVENFYHSRNPDGKIKNFPRRHDIVMMCTPKKEL